MTSADPRDERMPVQTKKPLMRSLGEAVGHIIKAIRTDPAKRKQTVRKTIEEQQRGDMILRRTTIEEVEVRTKPGSRT